MKSLKQKQRACFWLNWANFWLDYDSSVDIAPPSDGDGILDWLDLQALAANWLEGIE